MFIVILEPVLSALVHDFWLR